MNILKTCVLIGVVATSLLVYAAPPVAVRVDVEPQGPEGAGTAVIVTVQVSPEDRARIGRNAMVRIELDGDVPAGQSPLWGVRMENDGSGRIETVWPPGEHALRVEISNPSGQDKGLWVGTVRIPGSDRAAVKATQPPEPEPAPEPEEALGGAAAADVVGEPDAVAPPEVSSPSENPPVEITEVDEEAPEIVPPEYSPESDAAAVVAETLPVEPESEIAVAVEAEPEIEVSPSDPVTEIESTAGAAVEGATDGAAAAAAAAAAAVATEQGPAADVDTREADFPDATEEDVIVSPEPADVEPETLAVEPLRSGTAPPPGDEPVASGISADGSAVSPSEPLTAEAAATLDSWAQTETATNELTVVVFRDREPATGLTASDFRMRVGGVDVAVEAVGDAATAPLQLGVAVDVAAESGAGWRGAGGRLTSLVERASGRRGHVFFAADGRVGDWDREPATNRAGAGDPSVGGLTSLVVDSLARFSGRPGRTFLVVVTDGRGDEDKTAWKRATETAANAGVPILVIALWDESFGYRIRRNLKEISEISGGGLFLVQGIDQLDRAAERFGPIIDAGVALRFTPPPTVTLPAPVSVVTSDKSLEVTAPKGVR